MLQWAAFGSGLLALFLPGASQAQETQIKLNVKRISIPVERRAVLDRGVKIEASCRPSCRLVGRLKLAPKVAKDAGLAGPVIGVSATTASNGRVTGLRVRVHGDARSRFRRVDPAATLYVVVRALPPPA